MKHGDKVKGWCKCGQECDCTVKQYSNGTLHAHALCPRCGLNNAKQMRLSGNLEDLKHRLMGVWAHINGIPKGVDQDEAICMVERLAEDLWRETSK